jgi:hypothetical protein
MSSVNSCPQIQEAGIPNHIKFPQSLLAGKATGEGFLRYSFIKFFGKFTNETLYKILYSLGK